MRQDDFPLASASPALFAGERVLWSGRPGRRVIFRKIDLFLVPFSLFWAGFAVFWNANVWSSGVSDIFFKVWGVPFLLAGAYITVGRFLIDAYRLPRLRYFVTNQRLMIARDGRGSQQSLDIHNLPNLKMDEKRDGTGSLLFGEEDFFGSGANWGAWQATASSPPRFIAIPDVARVFQLIGAEARRS